MNQNTKEDVRYRNFKEVMKYIGLSLLGVISFFMIISTFQTVEIGYTKVYQNTFTGTKKVYHGPDWFISPPFIGKERLYKDDTTVAFSSDVSDENKFSSLSAPIDIRFADTYEAKLPLTARFVLPSDDEHMFAVDKSFRSYNNLVNSLYVKTMIDVTTNTAQQFTAEETTQGGLNALKSAISDQVNHGVYVTERKRVVIEQDVTSSVTMGKDKTKGGTSEQSITVWKAVPKIDKDGNIIRNENPFEKYGIGVSQVNLADPVPETLLERLLVDKKTSVAKKILSVQEQDNAKEDIKTAKLQGQANREKAEQERLIKADAEIIENKKNVKLAKLQADREIVERQKLADLAIIDKKKQLQIAKANEGIQKANERAAKYEAQAKLHVGLAEAKVKKAKYDAVDKQVLALEVQRSNVASLSNGLKNFKVQMPTYQANSGADAATDSNSLKVVMDALSIQNLKEINAKN